MTHLSVCCWTQNRADLELILEVLCIEITTHSHFENKCFLALFTFCSSPLLFLNIREPHNYETYDYGEAVKAAKCPVWESNINLICMVGAEVC